MYEKAWLDLFLSLIPVHSTLLDLGCGSGKPIADYLIQQGHTLIGVDSSDVMIAMAQKNFPKQTWVQADMRTVELDQKLADQSALEKELDDLKQLLQVKQNENERLQSLVQEYCQENSNIKAQLVEISQKLAAGGRISRSRLMKGIRQLFSNKYAKNRG